MDIASARAMALETFACDEYGHFGRPAYRIPPKKAGGRPGRTFMTLWIEEGHAVLMLDVEAQTGLVARYPKAFRPHPSKWGQQGATIAELVLMGEQTFRDALALAHAHAAR